MFESNFEDRYRVEVEQIGPTQEQLREVMERMDQEKQHPMKGGRSVRRVGRTLLAAAVLCALVTAAGAAGIALSQSRVHFFREEKDLLEAANAAGVNGYTVYLGGDYDPDGLAEENRRMWDDYAGGTLVEERQGTERDGWTNMRAFAVENREGSFRAELYRADKLSDLNGLWTVPSWDVSWLEEHYDTIPDSCMYHTETDLEQDALVYQSFIGGYERAGGASFTVECGWFFQQEVQEQYVLGEGVNYETQDGVTVAITMETTESGQQQFWADLSSGHMSWTMHGTGLTLEEIQEVVDHMGLAALCETA